MPSVPGFSLDLERLDGYPVAIGHGTYDQVIGVEWGREARDRLTAAGAAVTYRESPIPHTVDPALLPELAAWVRAIV
jgi:predicted esterase